MPVFAVATFERGHQSAVCMHLVGAASRDSLVRDQLTRWIARGRTADQVRVECIEITPDVFAQLQRTAPEFRNNAPERLDP